MTPKGVTMSAVTDIRAASEIALEQLSSRFNDLPRPVLAAIGAGDLALEQLAALRVEVMEQLAANAEAARSADVRTLTTELPAKAQHLATDYAAKVQHAATDYTVKAQQVATDYVGKTQI